MSPVLKISIGMGALCAVVLAAVAESTTVADAQKALDDGLPSVAIFKLKQAGGQLANDSERQAANLLLARAYNAAGRYMDTLALLETAPSNDREAQILQARALAATNQSEKALVLYAGLAGDPSYAHEATLGQGAMLLALGRQAEAKQVLSQFVERQPDASDAITALAEVELAGNNPRRTIELLSRLQTSANSSLAAFLTAKAYVALGEMEQAEGCLQSIKNPPANLAAEITITHAQFLAGKKDVSGAEKVVETYIDENSQLPGLPDVFVELDRIYRLQGAASGTELRRWAEDEKAQERAKLALYYLARAEARNSKVDRSRQLYRDFLQKYPGHVLTFNARTELAASYLAAGDTAQTLDILRDAPAEGTASFLTGMALASQEEYAQAAKSFQVAAQSPPLNESALFNAAVCNALAGIPDENNKALQEIAAASPQGGEILDKIHLTQGLFFAAQRRPEAKKLLQDLAAKNTVQGRRAALALAEWNYLQLDIAGARQELQRISNTTADPETQDRTAYLAVFLADTGSTDSDTQVMELANQYLKAHPDSRFAPDVRMKLAEILYRRGDFLGARTQFGEVADEALSPSLAETATFLSAQAMARSMDPQAMQEAIETYETVAKGGGPLALRARFFQANLLNSLKKPKEALGVFDSILDSKPDSDLRYATLIEKGDTLFAGGASNPESYQQAIATWQTIAADPAAPNSWKNQALTKMGATYQKLGDPSAALNCYYSVFSQGQKGEPEYFWFYKAGFDAGSLLESQKLWNEAIAVYEKISAVDGPRAEEARNRVNTLRLENFLWEN